MEEQAAYVVDEPAGGTLDRLDAELAVEAAAVDVVEASAALALAREALVAAHPDAIAELIGGASVEELRSSVVTARAAYARAVERAKSELVAAQSSVSAGAPARSESAGAALGALSPSEKIRYAIGQRGA